MPDEGTRTGLAAWRWSVSATDAIYQGTGDPGYDDGGVIEAESIGEAFDLLGAEIEWGLVDNDRPLTVTIERATDG